MDLTALPTMARYLKMLGNSEEFEPLLEGELMALRDCSVDPEGIRDAEAQSTELMDTYWLLAETPEKQERLAYVAHARAKAWSGVWDTLEYEPVKYVNGWFIDAAAS